MADAGGTGSRDILEALFGLISQAQEPVSVPFWVELLDYTRPRDQYAERRRTHALAGLARLVIRRNDPAALAALRAAMHHPRAEVRALAAHYLGRALLFDHSHPNAADLHSNRPALNDRADPPNRKTVPAGSTIVARAMRARS